jgi:hypothetical protein
LLLLGGRSDILAQWFTKRYIQRHAGIFKDVVIGPGEYAMVIRGGKMETPITQDQLTGLTGGLSEKIMGWLGGGEDLQLLVVDVRPKRITIPFSGFSKDHLRVGGSLEITFRIDPSNAMRVLNMITGPTLLDYKWSQSEDLKLGDAPRSSKISGIKELTAPDIGGILGKDVSTQISVEVLSSLEAKDIHENAASVSAKVKEVLSSMAPYWMEYGIDVVFPNVVISDNEYQEIMRKKTETELQQRDRDIEFFRTAGDEKRAVEIQQQRQRLEQDARLAQEVASLDYGKEISAKRAEIDIMVRRQNWEQIKMDAAAKEDIAQIENASRQKMLDQEAEHEAERKRVLKAAELYGIAAEIELQDRKTRLRLERERQEDSQDAVHLERLVEIGKRRSEQRTMEKNSEYTILVEEPEQKLISAPVSRTCSGCQETVPGDWTFCPHCGKAL